MAITGIVPQLRTTDMASSIRFYTEKLGFSVEFNTRIAEMIIEVIPLIGFEQCWTPVCLTASI